MWCCRAVPREGPAVHESPVGSNNAVAAVGAPVSPVPPAISTAPLGSGTASTVDTVAGSVPAGDHVPGTPGVTAASAAGITCSRPARAGSSVTKPASASAAVARLRNVAATRGRPGLLRGNAWRLLLT